MNDNKLSNIFSQEECEQKRTPQQLNEWVETLDSLLRETKKRERFAILESGIGKKYIREIHPLNLFAQYYYKGRDDIFFQPKTGNQSFDVQIFEGEKEIYKIEITEAIDGGKWALQKELLLEQGWAPDTGRIECETRKHNRHKGDIKAITEARESSEIFKENLGLIEKALRKKSQKSQKQRKSNNTLLLLAFDDYTGFKPAKNEDELKKFVNERIHLFNPNFRKIFLIGQSGNSFYEFSVSI